MSQSTISTPKKVSLEQGSKAFYDLREEAKNNGNQEMTLEEINNEIAACRKEKQEMNL